jgi:protein SCO1/2
VKAALFGVVVLLGACHRAPPSPPVLGAFPDFALTDQRGRTVRAADLRGHAWVADFVFTRCPSICPRLTEKMAGLAASPGARDLRFVSFSVDPSYDTPAVLAEYAAAHHADWTFLTGPVGVVDAVAAGAKLALERDPTKPAPEAILHGTHFLLIDAAGQIRGYYDSADDAALARLVDDAGSK